jgi:hypothetical protein
MGDSRDKNIREAIEKYGPITDRFVLRLGKSEEEAGKFESWHAGPEDFKTDLDAFLACLALTRLVDKVSERMKAQKSGIRAVKKEQRETAKALKKEADKLQKAIEKAEKKRMREEEKVKVKAEAKAERERLKLAKHTAVVVPVAAQEVLADVAATPVQISKAFSEVVTLQYEEEHVVTVAPTYKIPMEG